ncbi:lytic transglycosylase domain-containing protein [Phenylobacterium sp.]|uniref:lytic transglycosylase domain-containing protein n=1 Tax=Phenylobacterium sp. TaxID=1871053 RepID=UPI0035AE8F04
MRGRRLALATVAVLATAAAPSPVMASPPSNSARMEVLSPLIAKAAARAGLPAAWIAAVLRAESAGDPRAISRAGAIGLMQLMPPTWQELRVRLGLGDDPFEPSDNILAGAVYLRDLYDRYGRRGFLAAYNAGPERYEAYLRGGRALPAETRAYLANVASRLDLALATTPPAEPRDWRSGSIFAARPNDGSSTAQAAAVEPIAAQSPLDPRTASRPTEHLFVHLSSATTPSLP